MPKKPIIAIDIDDVLADTTDVLRIFVNNKHKRNLQSHHYHVKTGIYWGHYEKVWENHDINGDGIIDEFHASYVSDQSHVPAITGAVESLQEMHKNFQLIAISSRSTEMQDATERWLKDRFNSQFDSVICIGHGKKSKITKGQACKNLGARYLIDDNIGHCEDALKHNVQPVLFGDYGWHDSNQIRDNYIHCKNWQEVVEYFQNESTKRV